MPYYCPDNSDKLKDNDDCGIMMKEEGKFTESVEHLHYFVFRL